MVKSYSVPMNGTAAGRRPSGQSWMARLRLWLNQRPDIAPDQRADMAPVAPPAVIRLDPARGSPE